MWRPIDEAYLRCRRFKPGRCIIKVTLLDDWQVRRGRKASLDAATAPVTCRSDGMTSRVPGY